MVYTADNYADLLWRLAPRGRLWVRRAGSVIDGLFRGFAIELARIDARIADMLAESDPRTADETLVLWERVYGYSAGSDAERRTVLSGKVASRGGQTPAYFARIASEIVGARDSVTIVEWPYGMAFVVGVAYVGRDVVGDFSSPYYWEIHGPSSASSIRKAAVVALINQTKPAHTVAVFVWDL